jgi:DNA-nicking Smr family endonuclease
MADKDTKTDDLALFRDAMRDAIPHAHEARVETRKPPEPKTRSQRSLGDEDTFSTVFSDMAAPETIENEAYLSYQGSGVQHKVFSKLRAGKIHIEAALDLHGMTILKAEQALIHFVELCQQNQIRCVRVIHGKGWGSRDNKPVLKAKVDYWLKQSSAVLAFCSATPNDGGTGAVYVLLKRLYDDKSSPRKPHYD